MGARHVCLRKVDPGAMWELFHREGITHYNAAPTVHLGVRNQHRLARAAQGVGTAGRLRAFGKATYSSGTMTTPEGASSAGTVRRAA